MINHPLVNEKVKDIICLALDYKPMSARDIRLTINQLTNGFINPKAKDMKRFLMELSNENRIEAYRLRDEHDNLVLKFALIPNNKDTHTQENFIERAIEYICIAASSKRDREGKILFNTVNKLRLSDKIRDILDKET